jgi:hypothetical protein
MLTRLCLLALICLALVGCRSSQPAPPPLATAIPTAAAGTLVVDPGNSLGEISPYLLGSNYGPSIAVPADMLPAAFDSGVKAIRFPGGAWGDRNDLKPYQIDAFIAFCRQVGAIPTISVRLREGTPAQAAELVRYTNIEQQYGVIYWSIGNEPTLFAEELRVAGKADDYDTVQFNREWRAFAEAMKAVDANIKLVGPEVHQFNYDYNFNPKDSAGRDWMIEFLKANGDLVDVVTFHRYPFPRSNNDIVSVADLRRHTVEWDKTIPYLRQLISEHTGREIPIALTEVNSHWNMAIGGEGSPDSHYNAIWVADMLGRLMAQDVFMVNHWLLTSSGAQGGWGLIGRSELRPSYYAFRLYTLFGVTRVYAASGVEDVTIYAARREDGAVTVMIINLADSAQTVTWQLAGSPPGEVELWRLDPDQRPEAGSRFVWPSDGVIVLPGQSISLYIIHPATHN